MAPCTPWHLHRSSNADCEGEDLEVPFLASESYEWAAIPNLDVFFSRVYRYGLTAGHRRSSLQLQGLSRVKVSGDIPKPSPSPFSFFPLLCSSITIRRARAGQRVLIWSFMSCF